MLYLYHNDMSVCAQKVRMVLSHKNLEWQGENLNLRAGDQFAPEFLKVSPKAIVPILVHDGKVVKESNVIIQYLEETFPAFPLMPENALQRAHIRAWLTRLDAGLHEQIAVISFCLAFRYQLLKRYNTDESLEGFLSQIPDPHREVVMRDIVSNGMESGRLSLAVSAYEQLLTDLTRALSESTWLVGDQISLADLAFLPYIERLQQLQLSSWWQGAPQLENWLLRIKKTEGYKSGILEWHNTDYIQMMSELCADAWPKLSVLLDK